MDFTPLLLLPTSMRFFPETEVPSRTALVLIMDPVSPEAL